MSCHMCTPPTIYSALTVIWYDQFVPTEQDPIIGAKCVVVKPKNLCHVANA